MALTISGVSYDAPGSMIRTSGLIAFDSSYPTGGESLTAAMMGLNTLESVTIHPKNGFTFDYDATNFKVLAYYSAGTNIHISTTKVGNITTGEDALIQYTLPAATLHTDGMGIRYTGGGSIANNANTKTIKAYLGTTALGSTAMTASQVGVWRATVEIIRTGAATQQTSYKMSQGGAAMITDIEVAEPTEALSAALMVGFTGTSSSSTDDIVNEFLIVEPLFFPTGTGGSGFQVADTTSMAGVTGVRFIATGW
jgi:hypothetical protein